jgi:hypothetical protein
MSTKQLWEHPSFLTRVEEWSLRGKPKQNAIDWNLEAWVKTFPEHARFLQQLRLKNLGYLGRDLVRETVQKNAAEKRFVEGFLAVMIWGYADDARGPWRTKRILDQPIAPTAISKAYKFLLAGDVIGAYRTLIDSGPEHLGPAFATKYLYFGASQNIRPRPVILDSLITEGFKKWADKSINSTNATAQQYFEFLEYVETTSERLNILPEDVELIMFTEIAKIKGSQSWVNRQQMKDISKSQRKAWGLLLASEIMMRIPNLVLFQSEPGGGQYDCLSLREADGNNNFKADFNINGSIHFFNPNTQHYQWTELIERGVSSTCEILSDTFGWPRDVELKDTNNVSKSFRRLASLAVENISNAGWDFKCLVSDSSSFGQHINHDAFEKFSDTPLDLTSYPEIHGMPKEAWFWSISIDEEIVALLDAHKAILHSTSGPPSPALWP